MHRDRNGDLWIGRIGYARALLSSDSALPVRWLMENARCGSIVLLPCPKQPNISHEIEPDCYIFCRRACIIDGRAVRLG